MLTSVICFPLIKLVFLSFSDKFYFHLKANMCVLNRFLVLRLSLDLQIFCHLVLLSFHSVCVHLGICLHSILVGGIYRISVHVLVLQLFRLGWCVLSLGVKIAIGFLFFHYHSCLLLQLFLLSICLVSLRLHRRLLCWNIRQKSPRIRRRLADSLL